MLPPCAQPPLPLTVEHVMGLDATLMEVANFLTGQGMPWRRPQDEDWSETSEIPCTYDFEDLYGVYPLGDPRRVA